MTGAGVQRLKDSRLRNARLVRAWTAGLALLIAVGLSLVAGLPPAEHAPIEVYNFAAKPAVPDIEQREQLVEAAPPVLALRPAFQPKGQNIPTTRGRNRNARLPRRMQPNNR